MIKSKLVLNASWIIIGKIGQSLLGLIVTMLSARFLGPSNYGIISYAASLVAFVAPIMNLGFSNVLVQEFTNHPEDEGSIVGTSVTLSFISAIACMIGVSTYTVIADAGEYTTNIVVALYSLILVFQALDLIQYWFQAKLLSKYTAIVSLISYIVASLYKIILLAMGAEVYLFALSNSLDYCIIVFLLFSIYKKLGGAKITFSSIMGKRIIYKSKYYIVSNLMITVFAQTDKIMLKSFIGDTSVGYYSAAVTCAGVSSFVFSAIIDSFRPSIYQKKNENDLEGYEKNIQRLYCVVIYIALLQSAVMTILAKYIVLFLYGEKYLPAVSALQIIVWYTTFSYMGAIRDIWILGESKQKYIWILYMCGALMNILLNSLLIPSHGILGAAIASLITQIFTNVIMNIIIWPLRHNNYLIMKGLNPKLIIELFK